MPLDATIVEGVVGANFKSIAEMATIAAHGHNKRLDLLAETALGNILDRMNNVSVPEGLGISAAQRGDFSKQLADLSAAVASMQSSYVGSPPKGDPDA